MFAIVRFCYIGLILLFNFYWGEEYHLSYRGLGHIQVRYMGLTANAIMVDQSLSAHQM